MHCGIQFMMPLDTVDRYPSRTSAAAAPILLTLYRFPPVNDAPRQVPIQDLCCCPKCRFDVVLHGVVKISPVTKIILIDFHKNRLCLSADLPANTELLRGIRIHLHLVACLQLADVSCEFRIKCC